MSDTPSGNPQGRGDKRSASRAGPSSPAFVTALIEDGRLRPSLAECAAVSVLGALLRHLELDESQEPQAHLLDKLLEFLPARDATKDSVLPIEDLGGLFTCVGKELSLEPAAVEPLVRTVLQSLREFLSEGEGLDVERGLSWDIQYLWRRTQ